MFVFQDREHLPFVYLGQLACKLAIPIRNLLLHHSNKKLHVAGAEYVRDQLRIGLTTIAQIIAQLQE
uniref:Uncharacterized protein n=1 Tax=Arundo donax TaxID=35708 RepID=A0A0A9DBV1_ARUDO